MAKLARFVLGDGSSIWVEVDEDTEDEVNRYQRVARDKASTLATAATQNLQSAIAAIKPAAEELATTFLSLARQPSSVEIHLGLKLSGEAGAIIASTSAEGNIAVKLTWDRDTVSSGKPKGTKTT